MRVKQLNLDTDLGELGEIDGTVVIDPVMDHRRAGCAGRDDGEEGQVVDVQTRKRHRVDLVGGGRERSGDGGQVHQSGQPVCRAVLWVIRYFMPMPSSSASSI